MELVLRPEASSPSETGFSIVEVLIAAGLLLVIAVGVIPLFTSAMVNNVAGAESTTVSNFGKSQLERFSRVPFDNAELEVPGGSTESVTEEYWSLADEQWKPGQPASGDPGSWIRTTTVRQYDVTPLLSESEDYRHLDSPLDGNADSRNVHLKEITVEIESTREGGPLREGRSIVLRTLKVF